MSLPVRRVAPQLMLLAILVAACGGGGAPASGAAPTGDDGPATASTPADAGSSAGQPSSGDGIDTLEKLRAAIAADHGAADWFGDISDLTEEILLGARVVVVHTTLTALDPDFETTNRKRNEMHDALAALDQQVAPNIAMLDGDLNLTPLGSGGFGSVRMSDAFALPARAETAGAVLAWLNAVYGEGGLVKLGPDETWLAALADIRHEDPGWGSGKVLWLETSLPTYQSLDAQLLQKALMTTGSPLLDNWYLEAADGTGSAGSAAGLADIPVGADGFFYVP